MRVSSVQEALNGHSNDTVITPYTLNQVLDTLPSGGGGGITEETDPIFKRSAAYGITSSDIDKWNNNTGGGSSFSGDYNDLTNKPDIPDSTSDLVNDSGFITAIPEEYVTESELSNKGYLTSIPDEYKTKSENDALYQPKGNYLTSIPEEYVTEEELNNKGYLTQVPSNYITEEELDSKGFITQIPEESDPVFVNSPASDITDGDIDNWNAKQEPLVSGQNIKTINNQSLLGSGNITISGGGGDGTSDYNALENLPSINGTTLVGDKSLDDLGIQPKGNYLTRVPSEYVTDSELNAKNYVNNTTLNAAMDITHNNVVAELMPQIGDVLITSTNVGVEEMATRHGGEWELIDKGFKSATGTKGYTLNTTNCTEITQFHWTRSGHSITINIRFTNKVQIADTALTMFTIKYETLGITRMLYHYYGVFWSDAAKCAGFFNLNSTSGVFNTVDIIPDNYISAGRDDNSTAISFNVPMEYMLDEACDKFYWKRVA